MKHYISAWMTDRL